LELLRRRTQAANDLGDGGVPLDSAPLPFDSATKEKKNHGHINLFEDIELAMGLNAEHEQERVERERLEAKRNGIAPLALGGTQAEREKNTPWWSKFASTGISPVAPTGSVPKRRICLEQRPEEGRSTRALPGDSHSEEPERRTTPEKREKRNEQKDGRIEKKTKVKKRKKEKSPKKHSKKGRSDRSSDEDEVERSHKRSKSKSRYNGTRNIDELRMKRLEREAAERSRATEVIRQLRPGDEEADFVAGHAKRYHSQFFSSK